MIKFCFWNKFSNRTPLVMTQTLRIIQTRFARHNSKSRFFLVFLLVVFYIRKLSVQRRTKNQIDLKLHTPGNESKNDKPNQLISIA